MAARNPVDPAVTDQVRADAVEAVAPVPTGIVADSTSTADRRAMKNRYARTRDALKAQPRVRVRVPEDTFVGINGYQFLIQGRVPVDVPEQVAQILEESGRI